MEPKMATLSISPPNTTGNTPNLSLQPGTKPRHRVADSWEDDANASDGASEDINGGDVTPLTAKPAPNPPPPTPASPTNGFPSWESLNSATATTISSPCQSEYGRAADATRLETSTAVASRLIAAGLGMKSPRKTDEQKSYDKAMRENELLRRKRQTEAREKERIEKEDAVQAVWNS